MSIADEASSYRVCVVFTGTHWAAKADPPGIHVTATSLTGLAATVRAAIAHAEALSDKAASFLPICWDVDRMEIPDAAAVGAGR